MIYVPKSQLQPTCAALMVSRNVTTSEERRSGEYNRGKNGKADGQG